MTFPDVSVVEVDQESTVLDESGSVQVITDTQEVATLELSTEAVALLEVGIQGPPGTPGSGSGESVVYEQRFDQVSDTVVYRAEAALGSQEDASVWRIRRITITYGDQVFAVSSWANGASSFIHEWGQRLSYTYS